MFLLCFEIYEFTVRLLFLLCFNFKYNIANYVLHLKLYLHCVMSHGVQRHFQQYFSYIVEVRFIGEGNRSTRKKLSTCHKSLTNFITECSIECTSP